ncbi:MAG: S8 family serine peptidase [Pseudomonadota bacterium]
MKACTAGAAVTAAAVVGLSALLTPGAAIAARYAEPVLYDPTELIVQYRSAPAAASAKTRQLRLGLQVRRRLRDGRTQLLQLPAIADFDALRRELAADPDVAFAEPNYLRRSRAAFPDDPLFADQWALFVSDPPQSNFVPDSDGFDSVPGADMNLPAAWDSDSDGTADRIGSPAVVVAVIDDAFDLDHPDLAANFGAGRDLVDDDDDPRADAEGLLDHGTLVAGSLGAIGDNGEGIAGVAWSLTMMPLRIGEIRDGEVRLSDAAILDAYEYARTNGAQIVNASYGGPSFSQAERAAIEALGEAGILFVTSAGNFNSNLDYSAAAYPANYGLPNIVAVAASNRQDNVASFSQYGPVSTDVAAPGLQIVTTYVGGGYITGAGCGDEGGSCGVSGTSFSAPHVAGIAALIKSVHPDADYRELRARLIEGAEDGAAGGDVGELTAGGRVDAARSLALTPQPSLLIRSLRLVDDGNQRLDPGETLDIEVEIINLWQATSDTQATLVAPQGITVRSGPQDLGSLVQGATATTRFTIDVGPLTEAYRDLDFILELEADGGSYRAQRHFRRELAELTPGTPVTATLSTGLHDEFHTYHVDVAPTAGTRFVVCSKAGADIDLLVKYAGPPQYDIDLGAPPEDEPTFFTDADAVGGAEDGNEVVPIGSPRTGTYYVTVVNYALTDMLSYQLEAFLEPAGAAAVGASGTICGTAAQENVRGGDAGGDGGGGAPGAATLIGLLALRALRGYQRRRHACAKVRCSTPLPPLST